MQSYHEHILLAEKDHALHITLVRPKALNAINSDIIQSINKILHDAEQNNNIRIVVISGSGDKAFAAGADIKELQGINAKEALHITQHGHQVFDYIAKYPKPVIAKINGYALGGGLELALACHIRIAGHNAQFGLPEIKLGLLPGYGGTQRFSQLVGKSKAYYYLLTGDTLSAQQAYDCGLVTMVFPSKELDERVNELIQKLSNYSSESIRHILHAIDAAFDPTVDGYHMERESFQHLLSSQNGQEGITAFIEKRKPRFQ